jgi:3-oxoacyl-[acyl-carrier protein] reductase
MLSLEDKICIVTGGTSGIGLAIVNRLIEEKAKPIVLDIDDNRLESLSRISNVQVHKCDVTEESQIKTVTSAIMSKLGRIDVLINNVGILFSAPLISLKSGTLVQHDAQMWEKVLSTNLTSAFLMSKNVVECMVRKRTKGVLVNISSISAQGNAGQSAYAAAKAGLEALTKVWAKELPPFGIRCFGVAPGFCDTQSTHSALTESRLHQTIDKVPLRRLARPEEISDLLIAGVKNEYLNGRILEIDGGLVI